MSWTCTPDSLFARFVLSNSLSLDRFWPIIIINKKRTNQFTSRQSIYHCILSCFEGFSLFLHILRTKVEHALKQTLQISYNWLDIRGFIIVFFGFTDMWGACSLSTHLKIHAVFSIFQSMQRVYQSQSFIWHFTDTAENFHIKLLVHHVRGVAINY